MKSPVLNTEVGSWRHLVRQFSLSHLETSRVSPEKWIEKIIESLTDDWSGIAAWRVFEDHKLLDVTSAGQPLLDEL